MADPPPQQHVILILARNFASRLANVVFLVDAAGRVIRVTHLHRDPAI